jgi:hypothetical protein
MYIYTTLVIAFSGLAYGTVSTKYNVQLRLNSSYFNALTKRKTYCMASCRTSSDSRANPESSLARKSITV